MLLAAGVAVGSCKDRVEPIICTEIGCESLLIVQLASMPAGAFTVEILAGSAGGANLVYQCDGIALCNQSVRFNGYDKPSANVRVTTSKGSVTTLVNNIPYIVHAPNGDECPPVCKQATVTVPLPA